MNIDATAVEPRKITAMVPEGGGTMVRLGCGHLIWCSLPPAIFQRTLVNDSMHCAACLLEYLQAIRDGKPSN